MTTLNGKINLALAAIAALGTTVTALSNTVGALPNQLGVEAEVVDLQTKLAAAQTHLTTIDGEIGTEADDAPVSGTAPNPVAPSVTSPVDTVTGATGTDTVAGVTA